MLATFLAHSVSRAFGGIFEITRRTAQSMVAEKRWKVEVLGIQDSFTEKDLPEWQPVMPCAFPSCGPKSYGYAPALGSALDQLQPDVTHVHGLWTYTSRAANQWTKRRHRPYMISIHGMLDQWALKHSAWKKKLAGLIFQNAALRHAHCLHVNTLTELECVRAYGLENPVCVIPNGVDLPDSGAVDLPPWHHEIPSEKKVLLYIGRIHPKKGLPSLLQAWAQARDRGHASSTDWELAIAGWDQNDHTSFLRRQVKELNISNSVHFLGSQFGKAKEAAFRAASAFVLPSLSEGLPMAGLEALAYQLPLLITPECNLPETFSTASAIRIDPSPESIVRGLEQLFSLTTEERLQMGDNGHSLVRERFAWRKVARDMCTAYEWVLGGGACPAFIHV